ncbi:hypothetical protein CL659_04270 [bacterium]|nr:hypothetical protein [bacterium]
MLTRSTLLRKEKENFNYVFLFLSCFLIFVYFFDFFKFLINPISALKWFKTGSCLVEEGDASLSCSFARPLMVREGRNFEGWFYVSQKINWEKGKKSKILVLDKDGKNVIGIADFHSPHLVSIKSLLHEDSELAIHSQTLSETMIAKGFTERAIIENFNSSDLISEWFTVGDTRDLLWDWYVGKNEGDILNIESFDSYVVLVWKN